MLLANPLILCWLKKTIKELERRRKKEIERKREKKRYGNREREREREKDTLLSPYQPYL